MRRTDIMDGIFQVSSALQETALFEAFMAVRAPDSNPRSLPAFVEALSSYRSKSERYSEAAIKITKILGIDGFNEKGGVLGIVTDVLGSNGGRSDTFLTLRSNLRLAELYLPKFADILKVESSLSADAFRGEPRDADQAFDELTVVLYEEEHQRSKVSRLVDALKAVNGIYEIISKVENTKHDDLIIGTLDSGSDKSFSIIGAAKKSRRFASCLSKYLSEFCFSEKNKARSELSF